MHDHDEQPVDRELLEKLGYEHADVPVDRRINMAAVLFFAFFGASIVISWAFIGLVDRTQISRPADSKFVRKVSPPANAPILQSDATAKKDIETLRAEEDKKLHMMEVTDKEKGVARIPIEKAMEIVAERGLPTRPNAGVPADAP